MTTTELADLNERFAIAEHVTFSGEPGALAMIEIQNEHATARIALQGAQIIAFGPHNQPPILWVSQNALYTAGVSIRGGIPICWPWFGPHSTNTQLPQHGFVRTMPWSVVATAMLHNGTTEVQLRLSDSAETRQIWPHRFQLDLIVTVGAALEAELVVRNTDDAPWSYTGALHSYFTVGDIGALEIHGLDGTSYIDKVDGGQIKVQHGPITITHETDRVYQDTTATCVIDDVALKRRIEVAKSGSHATVIWNPWRDKAQLIRDFRPDEYTQMVCVETANAGTDQIMVAPGTEHRLAAIIRAEPHPPTGDPIRGAA